MTLDGRWWKTVNAGLSLMQSLMLVESTMLAGKVVYYEQQAAHSKLLNIRINHLLFPPSIRDSQHISCQTSPLTEYIFETVSLFLKKPHEGYCICTCKFYQTAFHLHFINATFFKS